MKENQAFRELARSIIQDTISKFDHTVSGFTFKAGKTFNDVLSAGKFKRGMKPRTMEIAISYVIKKLKSVVILDSNITTFLTGLVLFKFGGPSIRGFAVTLMAGIVATMISSIFFLKSLFLFFLDNTKIKKFGL